MHGEHRSEGHFALYHGRGGQHRDYDVLYLVYEDGACLLGLLKPEGLHLHGKEVGLCVFPFPPAAAFAVLELYLLHRRDELESPVLVYGLLLEQLVVYHLAPAQEHGYPDAVGRAPGKEDGKYQLVVDEEDNSENKEAEESENHVQHLSG